MHRPNDPTVQFCRLFRFTWQCCANRILTTRQLRGLAGLASRESSLSRWVVILATLLVFATRFQVVAQTDLDRLAKKERAVSILTDMLGTEHPNVVTALENLASLYESVAQKYFEQARFGEAEPLFKRGLAILENALGKEHPVVARQLWLLADLNNQQRRDTEAERLYRRVLAIREKSLGEDHRTVADTLGRLSRICSRNRRYAEAESLAKRALEITEKAPDAEQSRVAYALSTLSELYFHWGRHAEAEVYCKRSLATAEDFHGTNHPVTGGHLFNLALLYNYQGRYAEAEPLLNRAVSIFEQAVDLHESCKILRLRAEVLWNLKRKSDALTDLERALKLAEKQRRFASGAEYQRAAFFGSFSGSYELAIYCHASSGDLGQAFAAAERRRARELLNQLERHGVDLLSRIPKEEAQRLVQREREAHTQVLALEKQLAVLDHRTDLSPKVYVAQRERFEARLRGARADCVAAYADIRNAGRISSQPLSADKRSIALEEIQRRVVGDDGLMIHYTLSHAGLFVFFIPPVGNEPWMGLNTVPEAEATILGIDPTLLTDKSLGTGERLLTDEALRVALMNEEGTGVLQQLRKPNESPETIRKLAALFRLLIFGPHRQALLDGTIKRLIVVPDGPLNLLPFEALVVTDDADPKYLLDVGPPICYAPSATVLFALAERPIHKTPASREPLLTVGNPDYIGSSQQVVDASESVLDQLSAPSRYGTFGGKLSPLPFSGRESSWVATVFGKHGIKAARLVGVDANEANIRKHVSGRRFVHLACHGLADQSFGNLFGALALTPNEAAGNPATDGFLTMAEICELDLKSCELAILSACDTNFGPEQRGEGVWALSRGFSMAGARRVVASNWLVDDEAAANLVSVFCSVIARDLKEKGSADYAAALRMAKQWVRKHPDHPEWKQPYYWAPFVLTGPH